MNRGVLRRCCALSACLGAGIAWSAQAAAQASAETDTGPVLQEWDRQQVELRESVWRSYAATAALDKDSRGRTLADDLNDWLMTKNVQDHLSAARAAAERQLRTGDEAGARQTLETARAAVQEQRRVLALVDYYWQERIVLNRQRDLWLAWLKLAPDSVAAESKVRIDPLEANLIRDFSPTRTQGALTARVTALKGAYDQERIKLAGLYSEQLVADGKAVAARERRTACPLAAAAISSGVHSGPPGGADQPATIAMDMSPARFYPEDARRDGISGTIELRLTIGITGCMERAEVLRTSGAEELDQAAIDESEYVRYLPARHGDRPIRSSITRTITFRSEGSLAGSSESSKEPATSAAYVTQGNDWLNRREFDLAIADFDKAIEIDPMSAMAFAARGLAYLRKNELERAQNDLDAAYSIDARNPVVFRGRGLLALYANDSAAAIAAFSASLEIEPRNAFTLGERALAYTLNGEQNKALSDYAEEIQVSPLNFESYFRRAVIFRVQRKLDQSIGEAEALMAAHPTDAHAFIFAGRIYEASGKDAEATSAYDHAVEIFPDESTYLARAGHRRWTDRSGERADLDAALKLNPHSISAALGIAKLQSNGGDYADALETLRAAMAGQAESYELLTARGLVYAKSGQSALAASDFAAAGAKARSAGALNSICWSKATAGVALDAALADCEAAVAAAPHAASIIDSRAFVLLRMGRNDEAVKCYDTALRLEPLLSASLYGRGLAERREGKVEAASVDIRTALLVDAHIAERFADYGVSQ